MAAKTSLIIQTTASGSAKQKTISYANPVASNAILKEFAEKLVATTTETYVDTIRQDRISLAEVTAAGGGD